MIPAKDKLIIMQKVVICQKSINSIVNYFFEKLRESLKNRNRFRNFEVLQDGKLSQAVKWYNYQLRLGHNTSCTSLRICHQDMDWLFCSGSFALVFFRQCILATKACMWFQSYSRYCQKVSLV